MPDAGPFAWFLLLVAIVGLAAVLSNRLTARLRVPTPALVLIATAVAVKVVPGLHAPGEQAVARLVTVALLAILFDGGMRIGWPRFRAAAGPIVAVGVAGTFATAAGAAAVLHLAFGLGWYPALLVGTALAPTDPAVVFSVLGHREVTGSSGTLLEGESGANDPVGIALMGSLITAHGLGGGTVEHVAGEFGLQMGVGAAIGLVGGRLLLTFMRRVPLPSEGLYPLRTLAAVLALYGAATLAHGSGFLAVFIAGIVVGESRAPYRREIAHFHAALASLGEIVAFVVLGLTVDITEFRLLDVWLPGLVLAVLLALLIRPILVRPFLAGAGLRRNESLFVLLAGLKGAVPILLGTFLLAAQVAEPRRLYGIVVIVVAFSVLVHGSLVPALARLLHVPMRVIAPEPWSLGIRLREQPDRAHRLTVRAGSAADGQTIDGLTGLPPDAWISVLVRGGRLLRVTRDTTLQAGDDVVLLAEPELHAALAAIFQLPAER